MPTNKTFKYLIVTILFIMGITTTMFAKEEKPKSWQLEIVLDIPDMKIPAVQWSIFRMDPVSYYYKSLYKVKDSFVERLLKETNKNRQEQMRKSLMISLWNKSFVKVTGDKVFLLKGRKSYTYGFTTKKYKTLKWVVTKVVQINGEPYCWRFAVKPNEKKQKVKVVLNKNNAYNIKEPYTRSIGWAEIMQPMEQFYISKLPPAYDVVAEGYYKIKNTTLSYTNYQLRFIDGIARTYWTDKGATGLSFWGEGEIHTTKGNKKTHKFTGIFVRFNPSVYEKKLKRKLKTVKKDKTFEQCDKLYSKFYNKFYHINRRFMIPPKNYLGVVMVDSDFKKKRTIVVSDYKFTDKDKPVSAITTEFWNSTMAGSKDKLRYLLKKGYDMKNKEGIALFHFVVKGKDFDMIKFFVDNGADVNSTSTFKEPVLYVAIKRGDVEIVKYLIAKGADINNESYIGNALHMAVSVGSIDVVNYLIDEKKMSPKVIHKDWGYNLLHQAAQSRKNSCELTKYFVEKHKIKIDSRSKYGLTPLYLAVSEAKFDAVKYLISKGADINSITTTVNKKSILIKAYSTYKEYYMLSQYMQNDKSFRHKEVGQFYERQKKVVDFLIEKGADIRYSDAFGWNLLHYAAYQADIDMVKFLIKKGLDPKVKTTKFKGRIHGGSTPLLVVKTMLKISTKDANGKAITRKYKEIEKFLGKYK